MTSTASRLSSASLADRSASSPSFMAALRVMLSFQLSSKNSITVLRPLPMAPAW